MLPVLEYVYLLRFLLGTNVKNEKKKKSWKFNLLLKTAIIQDERVNTPSHHEVLNGVVTLDV